jgi:hypothetical protein
LDEPPKLAGFSFTQWLFLIVLGAAAFGLERVLRLPTQPSISAFTFVVGGPAALMFFSESGRPPLTRLARDTARWLWRARCYEPGPGRPAVLDVRTPATRQPRKHARRGSRRSR